MVQGLGTGSQLQKYKAMKENIPYICRPITSEIFNKFLGKVTKEEQVRGKKKQKIYSDLIRFYVRFTLLSFFYICRFTFFRG